MRAFAEFLDRLGIRVVVVEDIHWADEATLEFLLFLASLQPLPCSLVLTFRPTAPPTAPSWCSRTATARPARSGRSASTPVAPGSPRIEKAVSQINGSKSLTPVDPANGLRRR
jgi:hypothetical protein